MLIILQAINHFQEAILPLVIRKSYAVGVKFLTNKYPKLANLMTDDNSKTKEKNNALSDDRALNLSTLGLQVLDKSDFRINKSKLEGEQDHYDDVRGQSFMKIVSCKGIIFDRYREHLRMIT